MPERHRSTTTRYEDNEPHRPVRGTLVKVSRASWPRVKPAQRFAKRHQAEIDELKANADDAFAGLWIADKSARMAAYQADLELSGTGKYGSHWEQIRTRTQILKQVAEELGQMPPRAGIVVIPVTHVIEGVDVEALK